MKKLSNIYVLFVLIVFVGFAYSCSDDHIAQNGSASQHVQQSLNSMVTQWGTSKNDVINKMKGYTPVAQSSDDYLQFTTKDNETTIIYQFSNDKLCAAVLRISINSEDDNIVSLDEYSYVGIVDDNEIYEKASSNVFLTKYISKSTKGTYIILGCTPLTPMVETVNNKECVDLGLSKKWATCNVGANAPEEYGDFYAWGEITSKDSYSWDTYTHCEGSSSTTKSLGESICGTEYDVANIKFGNRWSMPTKEQVDELRTKCDWVWTSENGVSGYKVFGENGNYIFLPAAGYMAKSASQQGTYGYYYSGTPSSTSSKVYLLKFDNDSKSSTTDYRYKGMSIRPVCSF